MLLAVALAVRAPRLGHVHVDLESIRDTAAVESENPVDLEALPWPDVEPWLDAVAASPLVAGAGDADRTRPLRLERRLAVPRPLLVRGGRGRRRAARDAGAHRRPTIDEARLCRTASRGCSVRRPTTTRRRAAVEAVRRRFAVVAGGPGTGKTTTVARIVALLCEQSPDRPPLIALAAPTGKAAARLQEAVHDEAARLDVSDACAPSCGRCRRPRSTGCSATGPAAAAASATIAEQRLPHDVVIVDETSMVSLSLMARLIEALRSDARLVLVGDPGQLASIEAGAVLGDIVGADGAAAGRDDAPAGDRLCWCAAGATATRSLASPRRSGPATATR